MLEFITYTKGIEYLIAIAFLIAFVAFWQLAYGRKKGRVLKVSVLSYMLLGMIILVVSCVNAGP